jgi:hypothetical protein
MIDVVDLVESHDCRHLCLGFLPPLRQELGRVSQEMLTLGARTD